MAHDATTAYLGLDMGSSRIGVAYAGAGVSIAVPLVTIVVDGDETKQLAHLCVERHITDLVVGRPRNQSGEATAQTTWVENKIQTMTATLNVQVHFQDESLTSLTAETRLRNTGKPYEKGDIDQEAAVIILQDFLDGRGGARG